jgi:hypothetical protein
VHRQASAQRDGGVPGKTCDGLVSAPRESAETTDAAGLTDGLFSDTSWLEDLLPAALGEAPIMGRFGI